MTDVALPPILLVGAGRMGGALLAGWLKAGLSEVVVVEPSLPEVGPGVTVVAGIGAIPASFAPALVVFAVKPQVASALLPHYGRFAGSAAYLSIMAGRTIAGMAASLGAPSPRIVRAMPNTPAAVGQGVTVACAGPGVSEATRALCSMLLAAVGAVAWVEDEAQMDAVTAVSGTGPAYVFLLAEILEQAALDEGLPADLARLLARQTVAGSGALIAASGEDAAALRLGVTSPAGTTAAAMEVLMAPDAWPKDLRRAVAAATARSRALAG